jgi:shikimate dehydrogenase
LANIGKRPTVTSDSSSTVEVHILDFDRNIYEKDIEILFYSHLRDEKKFTSREELVEQINEDIKTVRSRGLYKPFALIGKNISHSNSEKVYKELLKTKYISYTLLDYSSEDTIKNIKTNLEKYSYISITSPYKKFFFDNVDTVEPIVKDLGSVNCIKLLNNKIIGTNTDYFAIKEIISSLIKDNISNILILGDGTMSGLVQYILDTIKIDFKVLSRKNNQLENLTENVVENSLIINTCARSYSPNLKVSSSCTFWDFNYNQEYAEELNTNKFINYYDGLHMLTLQAKYALSFWNLKTF